MTRDDFLAWARAHLDAATTARRGCAEFLPMVALRDAEGRTTIAMLALPGAAMPSAIALLVSQERAIAAALIMDTWIATLPAGQGLGGREVRDIPGRSDALVVAATSRDVGDCLWLVRYTEVEGELVEDEPQQVEGTQAGRLLRQVRWA